jgi:antitoxin component YwqK of YwqJK toxin-antitoxin module
MSHVVLVLLPLLLAGCGGDGGATTDVGPSTFEQIETLDRLKKELAILKWENSRLALKVIKVDGSQLVRDKNTGLWHHDVNRVPFTGRAIETYANGGAKGEASFLNGGQDGMSRFWYESGARKEESQWFDNRRHGFSRRWDEAGKLIESKEFKNGELIEVIMERR